MRSCPQTSYEHSGPTSRRSGSRPRRGPNRCLAAPSTNESPASGRWPRPCATSCTPRTPGCAAPSSGEPSPFWSAARPHSELPDEKAAACGIDRGATPTWEATLEARAERRALVGRYLADLTAADLHRRCAPGTAPPGLGADSDALTVADCVATILEEEEAHLGYATRDLGVLEGRRGDIGGEAKSGT